MTQTARQGFIALFYHIPLYAEITGGARRPVENVLVELVTNNCGQHIIF